MPADYIPTGSRNTYHKWTPERIQTILDAYTDRSGDCWLWRGSYTNTGYGRIQIRGKAWAAHRLTYTLSFGPIPDDVVIRHRCDNPACVRPTHLEPGSTDDNVRDRDERGRTFTGHHTWNARLTEDQVRAIRARWRPYHVSAQNLADEYGVHRVTIEAILHRRTWQHI